MPLNRKKIETFLKNPVSVRLFEAVDSTNNEAKRRSALDSDGVFLYVTDFQTAGRGRRGHDFYSPKGSGLYFTLALPLTGDPADIQTITCAAAVAVCEAVAAVTGQHPLIKWVNDICLDSKKVAGILTELVTDAQNKPLSVIVGVGINLTTVRFPEEFASRAGNIGDVDPNRLCAEIVNRLIMMYELLQDNSNPELKQQHNSIIEKYRQLNLCLGHDVTYTDESGDHTATAVDIAPDGSLIVEKNGVRRSLHSGEISIVPLTAECRSSF